jgi:hypothetical protein
MSVTRSPLNSSAWKLNRRQAAPNTGHLAFKACSANSVCDRATPVRQSNRNPNTELDVSRGAFLPTSHELLGSERDASADCIRQTIEVKRALDGIATVRMQITALRAERAIELVRLLTPHCRVSADDHVRNTEVAVAKHPGDPVRYVLAEPQGLTDLEWSYTVSNAVLLRRSDLFFCNTKAPWRSTLGGDETWNPYRVPLKCRKFVQSLVLPEDIKVEFKRSHGSKGQNTFQRAIREPGTLDVEPHADGSCSATMTVDDPDVGAYYGIVYKPSGAINNIEDMTDVAADIVRACITQVANKKCLSEMLADRVHRHLTKTLVPKPHLLNDVCWNVLLWSRPHRRLVPVFARGPIETWAVRFAYGNGIAGHSFRFGFPAGYVADHGSAPSLIHLKGEEVEGVQLTEYAWIAAFPLQRRLQSEHPAGVLTLSGLKHTDSLAELAKLITNTNASDPGNVLSNALHVVNCSVWSALLELQNLGQLNLRRHEAYLRAALESYQSTRPEVSARPLEPISPLSSRAAVSNFEVEFGLPWLKAKARGRAGVALACVAVAVVAIYLVAKQANWYQQLVQDTKALTPEQPPH